MGQKPPMLPKRLCAYFAKAVGGADTYLEYSDIYFDSRQISIVRGADF